MHTYFDRAFVLKLLRLAVPVSLQFLLHSSRYIIDMFMIGKLGEVPLAAVGLCTNIHMVANSVIWGLAGGIGIFCAQHFGAGGHDGLRRTVNMGVTVSVLVMLPIVLLLLLFPHLAVALGTNQPEVIAPGAVYLRITAPLPLLIGIVAGVGAGLNAMGRPHLNFAFTSVAVLSNVFLNWVLIFGNLGAPALGLEGAALATVASVLLEVVFIFTYLTLSRNPLWISVANIREAMTRDRVRRFLRVSVPLTIGGMVWHSGAFVYHAIYGHMGASELAVISMVQPIRTVMFAFFWGISSATGVIMGHHLGAGEFLHAWYRSLSLIAMGIVAAALAAVAVYAGEARIFSVFDGVAAQTVTDARSVLWVILLTMPLLAANVVGIVGVLQSGADTRFILGMDVFCQWAVGIPLCWLAAFRWNLSLDLVYLAAFGEEIIKVFIWVPRYVTRKWVRNLVSDR